MAVNGPEVKKILIFAANEIRAIVSQRIHNKGLAADGTKLGDYSASRKSARKKLGRQVAYIDLQDTGRLEKVYTNGLDQQGQIVLGFDEPYTVPTKDSTPKNKKKKGLGESKKAKSAKTYSLVNIVEERWKDNAGVHRLSVQEAQHVQKTIGKLLEQWRNNLFKKP